ncbi:hypothetical protein Tco_1386405 [Tanacetum coccineum]
MGGSKYRSLKAMNGALLANMVVEWRISLREEMCFAVSKFSIRLIILSSSFCQWEPGSGDTIMFWEDNWIGVGRLRDLFPRLYHLDVVNDAILSKKGYWREDEWVWNWVWRRSDLRGRAVTDVHNLSDLVQYFRLKMILRTRASGGSMMARIPALIVLDNMGIDLHSVLCPCCEESSESLDHCFVTCPKVKPIWDRVFEWWGVGMQNILSVEDVRNIVEANAFTGLKKRYGKGLFDLFKEVQGRVFEWIATRLKKQPEVGGLDQWFDYSSYVRTKVHT